MTVQEYLELYNKAPWYSKNYENNEGQREIDKEKIREYNRALINKFSWLLPKDRYNNIVDDYDWEFSELDDMPEGWRIAFGEKLCQEIQDALDLPKNEEYKTSFRIVQIKEKFGTFRMYCDNAPKEVLNIIDKYEQVSEETCIKCGKLAIWMSRGWISPYCDACAKNYYERSKANEFKNLFDPIKEFYKKWSES